MVWTPCWVSVDSRMKIGIGSAPSFGTAGPYPRSLIEIQERTTEVEERCQDEVGQRVCDPLPVLALRAKQRDQGQLRHTDDDHDRSERAEGVHVVGRPEPAAT